MEVLIVKLLCLNLLSGNLPPLRSTNISRPSSLVWMEMCLSAGEEGQTDITLEVVQGLDPSRCKTSLVCCHRK